MVKKARLDGNRDSVRTWKIIRQKRITENYQQQRGINENPDFLILTGRANDIENLSLIQVIKHTETFSSYSTTTRTLGAYKVAYHCRLQGFSVQVVDYSKFLSTEQFYNIIDKFVGPNTLAVGTSTTWLYQPLSPRKTLNMVGQYGFEAAQWLPVENFEIETEITQHIKTISPDCKIIVGGAIVNEDSLKNPNIDIVASGYGDVTERYFDVHKK